MSQDEPTILPESSELAQDDTLPAAAKKQPEPTPLLRVRMTYARREALRYVSHLDMQMVWERTLRRARMPLAYTKGFNPNPRLHLASALPLGFLSRCEITDFWLETPDAPALEQIMAAVQAAAPPGLEILSIQMASLQEPALQAQVSAAEYSAAALDPLDGALLAQSVADLLGAPNLPRERRGKPYDLRALIESLEVRQHPGPMLEMRLTAREGATGRPEEVLLALGLDPADFRVERTRLILA